jgi:HK97 family phage major capsid protein
MNPRLRALLERKQKALAAAKGITDAATKDSNRDLNAEEAKQFDAHMAEVERLNADIGREQALIAAERVAPAIPAGNERIAEDPRRGFRNYGEFCFAVMQAGGRGGGVVVDDRLRAMYAAAPATYGSEGSGADGGWLVPPEYSMAIFELALAEDSLVPMTDSYPVEGNSMVFPSDESTPWGTDGVRGYWEIEAGAANLTKPKVGGPLQLRLSKLMALVPITDELAADATALERWIGRKTSESIRWKTNLAFFQGSGVGQPLGFFGHASAVSVAKEAAQVADTVVTANVAKMFARLLGKRDGVWMIQDDVFPQLIVMTIGNQPIWTAPNQGIKDAPLGLLLGRPIMPTQLCKTVGDKGDIVLANWKAYRTITKRGAGIETATSMHLYFDAGLQAFRATFRVDGQPSLRAPVNPANGANTLSPFVTLDDRA